MQISVTAVNEWCFRPDGDIEVGMRAANEYVGALKKKESGILFSLWMQDRNDPFHFFRIIGFSTPEQEQAVRKKEETDQLVERLFPEIDGGSLKQSVDDLKICSGGMLEPFAYH